MKRYQWKWSEDDTYLICVSGQWNWYHVRRLLDDALATRLLRRAGRCVDDGCTGSAEKCAACCGRGGRHV